MSRIGRAVLRSSGMSGRCGRQPGRFQELLLLELVDGAPPGGTSGAGVAMIWLMRDAGDRRFSDPTRPPRRRKK